MYKIIGNKIKMVRCSKEYSQEYVSLKLGISQTAYSKLEKGKTSMTDKKLSDIAIILEVSKEEILNYSEENHLKTTSLVKIEAALNLLSLDIKKIKEKLDII